KPDFLTKGEPREDPIFLQSCASFLRQDFSSVGEFSGNLKVVVNMDWPPYRETSFSEPLATLASPFGVQKGNLKHCPAVGSVTYLTSRLSEQLLIALLAPSPERHKTEPNFCQKHEEFHCFILDQSASIVASNQADVQVGSFFGLQDP
ncbi:unnamed protein product, partial [Cyprideis torosa]